MGRPQPLAVIGPFTQPGGAEPRPETVAVATELRLPTGTVGCPSAVLLTGALRRAGLPVLSGPVAVGTGRADDDVAPVAVLHGATGALPEPGQPVAAIAYRAGRGYHLAGELHKVVGLWRAAARPRTVLLASPRSFCAGVERAIEVVEQVLAVRGAPIYVRKQIVHNTHVVRQLAERGAVFVDELDEVPDGATVVFSAHGVSPAVRRVAGERGMDVIDATCPLVTKVHNEARRYAGRGDTIVLIGHAGHEETEGTLGEAPDRTVLVETAADVAALDIADPGRVSYLTQTTLAVDETADVVAALQQRFPALRGPDSEDICYATTNRQEAVRAVVAESDVVLVVGSANSSNSVRLVELSRRAGVPAYLIEDAGDIDLRWLADAGTVGLTAGASAPPALVDEVISALDGLGPVTVQVREVTTETVHFALPRKVRQP
jgi:4-hydroxy-3-methylbut-2-enyl diphosphate reductase